MQANLSVISVLMYLLVAAHNAAVVHDNGQMNGAASIASGYINPMTVHNAIFGFAQAPKEGRHLLDETTKVGRASACRADIFWRRSLQLGCL